MKINQEPQTQYYNIPMTPRDIGAAISATENNLNLLWSYRTTDPQNVMNKSIRQIISVVRVLNTPLEKLEGFYIL